MDHVAVRIGHEKLISTDEPGDQLMARFRAEAQAAARLKHPNIVQIYEVGESAGRPYLALEYVEGGSLAEWIAGNPRPARDAARLVEVLARAVDAAHQQGIVHRDLKPANILLQRNGDIIPKITDFGLAKFVDSDTLVTQSGVLLGTASYMAPEQAAGHKRAVGPAADIYALGAILYELITGRPPFKAATLFETAILVSSAEPVSPRQFQPHTPRDLETVCLKCLEKDPARRYGSAQDLADDLRRFLTDQPVRARPAGPIERMWRWSRRNRMVAALITAVVCALLGGTIISSYFALRNRALVERERLARNEADAKRRQAEAVSRYLVDAFRSSDPERDGRQVTVAEVLDRVSAQLDTEFPEHPVIKAELAAALGQTYLGLGLSSRAVELLEQCRDLMEKHAEPDDEHTIASLHLLARAYSGAGRTDEAVKLAQQAFDRMRAKFGEDHPDTMVTLNTLARAYHDAGQMQKAAELHEKTLTWARTQLGETNPERPSRDAQRTDRTGGDPRRTGRLGQSPALLPRGAAKEARKTGRRAPTDTRRDGCPWASAGQERATRGGRSNPEPVAFNLPADDARRLVHLPDAHPAGSRPGGSGAL